MRVIHRHSLKVGIPNKITLTRGWRGLHFGWQEERGQFSVWIDQKVGEPEETVEFQILPTGAAVNDSAMPCGSCIMPDGFHIFHLYGVII